MLRNHLAWDNQRHSVGIASIDSQHQRMIELINHINDTLSDTEKIGDAWEAVDELLVFTETHFAHEEEVMAQHGYPGLACHAEEHRKLLAQMRNLVGEARHSPSPVKARLVPAFLSDWAERHILRDDRKLGAFLAETGKNPNQ